MSERDGAYEIPAEDPHKHYTRVAVEAPPDLRPVIQWGIVGERGPLPGNLETAEACFIGNVMKANVYMAKTPEREMFAMFEDEENGDNISAVIEVEMEDGKTYSFRMSGCMVFAMPQAIHHTFQRGAEWDRVDIPDLPVKMQTNQPLPEWMKDAD